jgi:iron complex outermembrane receptor protein
MRSAPLLALFVLPACALAAPPVPPTPELGTVQVVATRVPAPARAVPAAVSVVEGAALERPSANANLSEKLQEVPGLLARERQNYAQDLQVSVRGFGARATFGIRGIRLYLDGIPATMPDGQGQVSHFNLASLGRIEVLRGPFSALHGNAAGGVIQAFSADGADAPGWRLGLAAGGDALQRETLDWRGGDARFDYLLDYTRLRTGGWREHGAAARDSFNLRLKAAPAPGSRLLLLANALDSPEAQDPLGLNADQVAADPRQATAAALLFDTRKALRHQQLGLAWEQDLGASQLRVQVHGGERRVLQFLSVPASAQANPLSGGGVVDLDSSFSGIDLRLSHRASLGARPFALVLGATAERQRQHRLGFENFEGARLGVRGRLRRDQYDYVASSAQYLQATWEVLDGASLMAGVRRSRVWFRSDDAYVTAQNPDDSGRADYSATTPALGASLRLGARWTAYASHGRGFETPTFDELGYRPDGSAGLNFDLRPARTRSSEAGLRADYARGARYELTAFRADTRDELAVASNSGGRSTYRNIGRARRQGVEAFASWPLRAGWRASFAGTWLDARYRDDFLACAGSPCPFPTVPVAAGAAVPGVPRAWLSLAADYDEGGRWQARAGLRHAGAVAVDSARPLRAPGWTVLDAEAAWRLRTPAPGSRVFLRVDNLLDRDYVGSVIVNEANGRYFEPAPGRSVLAGIDLRW